MSEFSAERRRVLLTFLGLPAAAGVLAAPGCAPGGDAAPDRTEAPLRVPLASLPAGTHVRVVMGERPVDLLRDGDRVVARSLWCTHMGCEVEWRPGAERYVCRCHGGEFDAQGEPVAGPPPRALRVLAVRIEGADAIVEPPGPAS